MYSIRTRQKTQKLQRRRRRAVTNGHYFLTLPSQRRVFGAKKGPVRASCAPALSLLQRASVLLRQSRAGKNEGRQPAAAAGLNLLFWLQSFVFYYVSACCGAGSGVCVCVYELFLRPRRLHNAAGLRVSLCARGRGGWLRKHSPGNYNI